MIPYLLHIAILIAGAYLFYKLFLEKETFFQVNRWVLLAGVLVVVALPFLQIPVEWSLRSPEKVKPKIEAPAPVKRFATESDNNPKYTKKQPAVEKQSSEKAVQEFNSNSTAVLKGGEKSTIEQLDFTKTLLYVYFIGLAIFGLNFLIQLMAIFYQIYTRPKIRDGNLRIVKINKNRAPFSFWNWIFMNPADYDPYTYRQILQHEQIHVLEKHTLDILLTEILVVFQWFNPFAWFYRKAVENNLEYLTDQKMLLKGSDRQAYQLSLLRVAVPDFPLQLTTNYNQSFLKKRISMMNARKSSLRSVWKYLFLLPLLALSVLCLNAVKSTASETFYQEMPAKADLAEPEIPEAEEPDFEAEIEVLIEPEADLELEIAPEPELDISELNQEIEAEIAYAEFKLTGNWSGTIKGNELCISFHRGAQKKKYQWYNTECFDKSAFGNLPTGAEGTFELKGDAGTITFQGKFVNDEGKGTYAFTENSAFRSYLSQQGYDDISERLLFHCVLSGVDKSYLAELKNAGFQVDNDNLNMLAHTGPKVADLKKLKEDLNGAGYPDADLDDLLSLTIHEVDLNYIKDLKAIGYPDLSLDKVVQASIHDISPQYFTDLKAAGVTDLEFDELLQFAIHDIDAEMIQKFEKMGFDLNNEEVIQFAIHDIEPATIEQFKSMGFANLSTEEIIQASIHNVSPEYLNELKAAGMGDMDMEKIVQFAIHDIDAEMIQKFEKMGFDLNNEEVIQFAIHDIKPATIEQFKSMGFANLSTEEIIQASIHNVSPEYLNELKAAGMGDMEMEKIVQFAIHDIDAEMIQKFENMGFDLNDEEVIQFAIHDIEPATIEQFKSMGFDNLTNEEVLHFAIHNVDAKMVRELTSLGFRNLSPEEIVQASIHDVDADFIRSMHDLGFKNADMEDLVQASIHDVDADYIKAQQAKGKTGLSLEEYIHLKIHSYRYHHDDER